MSTFSWILTGSISAMVLVACSPTTSPLNRANEQNALAMAALSSMGTNCGVDGADAFQNRFIIYMQDEQGVTDEGVTRINEIFDSASAFMKDKFSDPAKKAEICGNDREKFEKVIQDGINGQFLA